MRGITVHFNNGETISTRINGTSAEIWAYYNQNGGWINLGDGACGDRMAKVTHIVFDPPPSSLQVIVDSITAAKGWERPRYTGPQLAYASVSAQLGDYD